MGFTTFNEWLSQTRAWRQPVLADSPGDLFNGKEFAEPLGKPPGIPLPGDLPKTQGRRADNKGTR